MSDRGRPSKFDPEIAQAICERLASGVSLREICRTEGMPPESTVRGWAIDDVQGFSAHYARAREAQLETWADEIIEIAEDGSNDWIERKGKDGEVVDTVLDHEHVTRSRLRIDTRKWLMSKLAPKKYGEKIETTHQGPGGGPIVISSTDAEL